MVLKVQEILVFNYLSYKQHTNVARKNIDSANSLSSDRGRRSCMKELLVLGLHSSVAGK